MVAPIVYLSVSPVISLLSPNQTRQLSATARLADGSSLNVSALVQWGTLFGWGATISPTGLVTANRFGISIFTASLGRSTGFGSVVVFPRGFW